MIHCYFEEGVFRSPVGAKMRFLNNRMVSAGMAALAILTGGTLTAHADDSITPATVQLQDLILVDYRERSPNPIPLSAYHEKLIEYMKPVSAGGQGLAPPRLILYINCPCASDSGGSDWLDFYTPTNACTTSGSMNFPGFLKAVHDEVPGTEVEILIDYGIANNWSNSCWNGPTPATFPVALTSNWAGIPAIMEWVRALYDTLNTSCSITPANNPLKGITFDQEVSGQTVRDDIAIILNLDWFKHQANNTDFTDFRIGMMPGVGGTSAYSVLVSDFPISQWPGCLKSMVWECTPCQNCTRASGSLTVNFTDFDANLDPTFEFPSWRNASSMGPLLQSCYLQVYSACASQTYQYSFYKWANAGNCQDPSAGFTARTPEEASIALSGSLRRVPSTPGEGTVAFTNPATNTVSLVGTGTNFQALTPNTRMLVNDNGTLLPDPNHPLKIENVVSDTAAEGSGCAPAPNGCQATSTSLPWVYTEIPALYASPPLPSDGNTRMYFMFSAENYDDDTNGTPFFGNWTKANFLDFVGYFYAYTQKYPIWSIDNSQVTTEGIPLSNFVIYDINWMCKNWSSMASMPPCSTSTTEYCPADLDQSGSVNGRDLALLLGRWSFECSEPFSECFGDLNHDGTIDGADLTELLNSWGSCEG